MGRLFGVCEGGMPEQDDEQQEHQDQTGGETPAGDGQDEQPDGLRTALQREREARRQAERRAREAERERDALRTAGQSDAERIAAERDAMRERVDRLTETVRTANGREAVRAAAKAAGAPDPDLIWRLAKADIEYDDDDEPTNVDRLLLELKRDYPDQFRVRPGKADPGGEGAKGAPPPKHDMNQWIRHAAGRGV